MGILFEVEYPGPVEFAVTKVQDISLQMISISRTGRNLKYGIDVYHTFKESKASIHFIILT